MRFLGDACIDIRVIKWLRSQGYDAIHLREEGLQRLPDEEIFKKAISENRVILTFDMNFGEIIALSKGEKASVILFRFHNTRTSQVIVRLSAVLADSKDALDKGAVVIIEESRHRIRYFPIGS